MGLLNREMMQQLSQLMAHGINMGAYMLAGAGLGWLMDRYLGFPTLGYLIFVPLGLILGFVRFYKAIQNKEKTP